LPAAFPPWQLVSWYFVRWQKQRDTLRTLDVLRHQIRRSQGRGAAPSAGIIAPKRLVGWLVSSADQTLRTTVDRVPTPAGQKGFAVLPRRSAVERTLA
jgi:transposase